MRRLLKAFCYSLDGIKAAWRDEPAFQQEAVLAAILVPIAFWLDVSGIERLLLIASVVLVMIMELLNSAIEAVVNRISLDTHPLSKKAKDCGSAAVFIAILLAAYVWLAIII